MPKYIDADNLKTILEERRDIARRLYGNLGGAVSGCIKLLDQQPAADVEPKRKIGRWIWDDEGFHCSECWFHAYGDTGDVLSGYYHYCPHCGAKMYKETDDV